MRTAEMPPALSNTAWSGEAIASARKENALTRLLFPEPLRPTKIVGLSNVMRSEGMLRKRFNTSCLDRRFHLVHLGTASSIASINRFSSLPFG